MIAMQYGSGNVSIGKTGLQMDLLWTNTDPTSNFAGQTISLDLSAYSFVLVQYGSNTSTDTISNMIVAKNGTPSLIQLFRAVGSASALTLQHRSATATDTGVTFSACSNKTTNATTAATTNNAYNIPIAIYGIK